MYYYLFGKGGFLFVFGRLSVCVLYVSVSVSLFWIDWVCWKFLVIVIVYIPPFLLFVLYSFQLEPQYSNRYNLLLSTYTESILRMKRKTNKQTKPNTSSSHGTRTGAKKNIAIHDLSSLLTSE